MEISAHRTTNLYSPWPKRNIKWKYTWLHLWNICSVARRLPLGVFVRAITQRAERSNKCSLAPFAIPSRSFRFDCFSYGAKTKTTFLDCAFYRRNMLFLCLKAEARSSGAPTRAESSCSCVVYFKPDSQSKRSKVIWQVLSRASHVGMCPAQRCLRCLHCLRPASSFILASAHFKQFSTQQLSSLFHKIILLVVVVVVDLVFLLTQRPTLLLLCCPVVA